MLPQKRERREISDLNLWKKKFSQDSFSLCQRGLTQFAAVHNMEKFAMRATNLDVVVAVVVEVEDPVDLAVRGHVDVLGAVEALAQGLAGILLHLDVVELSEKKMKKINS